VNPLKIETWSDRQQVLAIIVVACLAMGLLWFFLLAPQMRDRRSMSGEIRKMRSELHKKNYMFGETALKKDRDAEQKYLRGLSDEWIDMAARLAAFTDQHGLARSDVAHIDYKMALFSVRNRLVSKSRDANISLPIDLGLEDAVASNEDARKRMLQLRAVENLVDLALDLDIDLVQQITPLDPIEHKLQGIDETFLEEYPVRLEFFGTVPDMYDLLHRILEPGHVFVLRNVRIETPSRNDPASLRMRASLGALVFPKDPDELMASLPKVVKKAVPMGH
jgi:hypothetical protein